MSRRHRLREYEPVRVDRLRPSFEQAAASLTAELQPTIRLLSVTGDSIAFRNVIGSFALPNGDVAEVAPKIDGEDWTTSVIELLSDTTRLSVTGSQRSRPSARKNDLSAALALEYARRLERALRADGPLQVYERRHELSRRPNGRLDVSKWVRQLATDPVRYPLSRDDFTVSNDFTRGLSVIAGLLSRSAPGGEIAAKLRRLQAAVVPGTALPSFVDPAVGRRTLPAQWSRYLPAWDIAAPLLRNRSVVGRSGHASGLEVAVEPWPLLETMLERALERVHLIDSQIVFVPKGTYPLLRASGGRVARSVEPDGLLRWHDGRAAASFEAKYTTSSADPKREHVFQALATASALRSPVAVIVLPNDKSPQVYDVTGFNLEPRVLVTVGLPLFNYRKGPTDLENAQKLLTAVSAATRTVSD